MKGVADESVGEGFREDLLQSARDRTLAVIQELASHVKPGFTEKQTKALLLEIQTARAAELGWQLTRHEANGHRIADFPHAARSRGSIETFAGAPAANRWILEIQIRHPEKPFGAFYEDLLN